MGYLKVWIWRIQWNLYFCFIRWYDRIVRCKLFRFNGNEILR